MTVNSISASTTSINTTGVNTSGDLASGDAVSDDVVSNDVAPHIAELWVYPVKSLGGIRLKSAHLTPEGLAHDRRWLIIDEQGLFVTQRKVPQMGLITCEFYHSEPHDDSLAQTPSESIKLTAPNGNSCILSPSLCKERTEVKIWADTCDALLAPAAINTWLNQHIAYKSALRLVYFDPCFRRSLDHKRFDQHSTGFADAAPVLLCNANSLRAVNTELKEKYQLPALEMSRFRPNIVVDGLPAFAEHDCSRVTLSGSTLNLVDKCQRCVMISLSPSTGERAHTNEIFAGISRLNSMPKNINAPAFGVNCTIAKVSNKALDEGLPVNLNRTPL